MSHFNNFGLEDENFGPWRKTVSAIRVIKKKIARKRRAEGQKKTRKDDEGQKKTRKDDEASADSEDSTLEEVLPAASGYEAGLRYWSPALYAWVQARLGTKTKAGLILMMMLSEGSLFAMQEDMYSEDVSVMSIITMANLLSLLVSVVVSFLIEGMRACPKIFNAHSMWRFFVISAMFVVSTQCTGLAFKHGLSTIYRNTLGYLYLPFAAIGSYILLRRKYGQLEWLSLLIMMMGVATFILLRERCKAGDCAEELGKDSVFDWRVLYVLVSVVISVVASLLAERIYKGRSVGLRSRRGASTDAYYIMKVHLDFSALVFSLLYWAFPTAIGMAFSETLDRTCYSMEQVFGMPTCSVTRVWFGNWTRWHVLFVFVSATQWWMAGLISKRFSTVVKSIVQSIAIVVAIGLKDPLMHLYRYEERWIPSVCMACVIVLSALMFQTGRINIKRIRMALGQVAEPVIVDISLRRMIARLKGWLRHHKPGQEAWSSNSDTGSSGSEDETPISADDQSQSYCGPSESVLVLIGSYSVLAAYVIIDAARTEMQTIAMGGSMITPQSMAIMTNVASLALFNVMVYMSPREGRTGWQDVRASWNLGKIVKFMPCGMLFAATSALMSMGMGLGISGSMSVVVGKVYLPVAALASRWVLGKFYMWLEWFAIVILTLDSAAFGFLHSMGETTRPTNPVAIFCVIGAAVAAALNSLVMEMLMQKEADPFIIQKVRLDAGSVLWSVAFLPVMGWLADPRGYPQGAYWAYRASTRECTWTGYCEDSMFVYVNSTSGESSFDGSPFCAEDAIFCGCYCAKGVFAFWETNIMLYMMLFVSVLHSTIVGMVVKRFSSVYRAVADNFSLLLVYFVADPWVWGTSTSDKSTNLTAFILPLSSQTFSQAATELKRVEEVEERQCGGGGSYTQVKVICEEEHEPLDNNER